MCVSLPTCHNRAVNRGGGSKPKPPRVQVRRRLPLWALCLVLCLVFVLLSAMFYVRYGLGWAVTWAVVSIASLLPVLLIKPATWRTWPRKHLSWAFAYFVFFMTTLFFDLVALLLGLWLSPWWCLVISLCSGVLTGVGIWPAQLRYYELQRSLADTEQKHRKSGSSDGTSSR
jgi:phosphatidylserine synthase